MNDCFTMVRGESKTLRITLTDSDDQPYLLAEGELLRFGVKAFYEDKEYVLTKVLTPADLDEGAYVIHLLPADTKALSCGTYWYDVGLQTGVDYYQVVPYSEFRLLRNITQYEAT